jgi:hypothetical protein
MELAAHVHPAAGGQQGLDLVVGGGAPAGVERAAGQVEGGEPGPGLPVDGGDGAAEVEPAGAGAQRVRLAGDRVLERGVQRAGLGAHPGQAVALDAVDGGEQPGRVDRAAAGRERPDPAVGARRPVQQLPAGGVDGREPGARDLPPADDGGGEVPADVDGVAGERRGPDGAVECRRRRGPLGHHGGGGGGTGDDRAEHHQDGCGPPKRPRRRTVPRNHPNTVTCGYHYGVATKRTIAGHPYGPCHQAESAP